MFYENIYIEYNFLVNNVIIRCSNQHIIFATIFVCLMLRHQLRRFIHQRENDYVTYK